MESQNPLVEGNMRIFHDGVDGDRELLPTGIALNRSGSGLAIGQTSSVQATAMRALGTVRPADGFQVLAGLFFVELSGLNQIHLSPLFL